MMLMLAGSDRGHVVARAERRRAAAVIDFPSLRARPPSSVGPRLTHFQPDNEVNGRRERLLNFNYTGTPDVHVQPDSIQRFVCCSPDSEM